MVRLVVPLAVLALGALTWLLLSDDASPPSKPAAPPSEAANTPPQPLPPLASDRPEAADPDTDHPPPEVVEAIGPLGLSPSVLAERMKADVGWRPVEGVPHTWDGFYDTRLSFRVKDGRVVGAQAVFPPHALSASLKALSPWLVGTRDALPLHLEAYTHEQAVEPRQGTFTTARGVVIHFRGRLRTEGDPPYGPESLEISLEPFTNGP